MWVSLPRTRLSLSACYLPARGPAALNSFIFPWSPPSFHLSLPGNFASGEFCTHHLFFFFFLMFIFGCVGSSLLPAGFLQLRRAGATLHCTHTHNFNPLQFYSDLRVEASNTQSTYSMPCQVFWRHHIQSSQQSYETAAVVVLIPILQMWKLMLNKDRTMPL